ncbi:MAG: ATP-binding protein [Raineya sp.]|jgi:signal transduction histidine kinase|nr:ATP-binding protein [Raineya sp.]
MLFLRLFTFFIITFLFVSNISAQNYKVSESWSEILAKKEGDVEIVWTGLEPFIYQDKNGILKGIEVDLLREFFTFLEKKYKIKIRVRWREVSSFSEVEPLIRSKTGSYFGTSAISITEDRKRAVAFTPPYMPDISVLISHANVPIFVSKEEFIYHRTPLIGFTARGSTYDIDLKALKIDTKNNFSIKYIDNSENLVEIVHSTPNSIAYMDFPIYLKYYEKGYRIKRQFIFKTIRDGYAFILPKHHDWQEPINTFFKSSYFKTVKNDIIRKHIGPENLALLWDLSGGDELKIFKKEYGLQDKNTIKQIVEEEKRKNLFTISIITSIAIFLFLLIIFGVLYYRYKIRDKANKVLTLKNEEINQQKAEIEAQRDYIEQKNKEISDALTQIQKQKEQLEEVNQSKDRFFSIIAHDLRSPINSLLGFTNLLSNYADAMTTDEVKKISNDLNKSLQNVLQLIEDLLTWARSQMNKVDFKPENVSINQIIREDLELSNILFQKKEIFLKTEVEPDLYAFADADHVKFVLRNLITNALKFTNRNGEVCIKAFNKGKFIQIDVKDNGVGMPPEFKEKLFKMDTVKSTTGTDNEKGTGLGLLLCKEFIKKNGGDIWVDSKENEGSCFSFTLVKTENS